MVYRSCPVCSAEYGKTGPETLDALRSRAKELEEQKKILFEQNGKLLAERELGQWDANCEENSRLRKVVEAARAVMNITSVRGNPERRLEKALRELDNQT